MSVVFWRYGIKLSERKSVLYRFVDLYGRAIPSRDNELLGIFTMSSERYHENFAS
jgi:hypothetical protein